VQEPPLVILTAQLFPREYNADRLSLSYVSLSSVMVDEAELAVIREKFRAELDQAHHLYM